MNIKNVIKSFIVNKLNDDYYEITDIRKTELNTDEYISCDNHFFGKLETDQIIYRLCKVKKLKTEIIETSNDSVKYIISNKFIYNTKYKLDQKQINDLKNEFLDFDEDSDLNDFVFINKQNKYKVEYITINNDNSNMLDN
jgi:hypothetical protein